MAELPGLGAHCDQPDCRQLDFLPLVCQHCQATFCRDHVAAEEHGCTSLPQPAKADLNAPPQSYRCHLAGCDGSELTPVSCPDCCQLVCLAHRHPSEHACAAWQAQQARLQQTEAASRQADEVQQARLAAPPAVSSARSERARKTAATVQLMRLKQRASGDGGVPLADRHYLLLLGPGGRGAARPVFVSRRWPLGRAVDALADMCSAKNENDRTGGRRLLLFRRADGGRVGAGMDAAIADLPTGQLHNGETVVLEYGDPTLTSRPELTRYSLS